MSAYLAQNITIKIAKKTFSLVEAVEVDIQADVFHKSYLSGMVNDPEDINKLWNHLIGTKLFKADANHSDQAILLTPAFEKNANNPLSKYLTDDGLKGLSLALLAEGNEADKKARLARLKQALSNLIRDVAKVRLVTFDTRDENSESVDRLGAGLEASVGYAYGSHFDCRPEHLGKPSASRWEHARSYLFDAGLGDEEGIEATTEIGSKFNYHYVINNTIGQWEDWDASLALEFNPTSATDGAALSTTIASKLEAAIPSEKGLSVEAWVKPAGDLTHNGSIVFYKKADRNYSLGVEKQGGNKYIGVATLGDKIFSTKNSFPLQGFVNGKEQARWRHLAFTHKKYWGFHLGIGDTIHCGNDDSLQLSDEFTMEILARIDPASTILEKEGEYRLAVNNKELVFSWGDEIDLVEDVSLDSLGEFYKITLIRSRIKPPTEPSKQEYPITGDDGTEKEDAKSKWYEDKSSDEMMKGMAEKQDQMDEKMEFSESNMLGNAFGAPDDQESDYEPTYYHSLVISGGNGSTEWTSSTAEE